MADYGYGANDLQGLDAGMDNYPVPINRMDSVTGGINGQPDESGNFNNFPGGFAGAPKAGGLGDFVQGLFTDKGGNLNTQLLGGIGGGILGALGANTPNVKKVGYQGGIPKYDAVRNMVTAPPTKAQGYRPGQGGVNYGGDVTYTRQPGSPAGSSGGGGGGSSTLGNLAKVAGGAGLAGLLANYLGNSGGASGIGNIISGITGGMTGGARPGAPAGGGGTRSIGGGGGAPVSNMGGGTRGTGELTTPGGEYAGADEFDGIDAQIGANEMDLASPSLSEEDIQAEFDRIYGEMPPPYMPTYDEIYPSYDWGSGITMDDPYDFLGFAKGGSTGRYLQGETDGMADKIPARIGQNQPAALSHGEFVVPADVVSHLGNGNSDAGAKKLYSMMDKIRQARTGTKKQGKEINPDKFMPGGLAQAYAGGGSVQRFNTGGTAVSGLGTAANAGVTGSETTPNTFAGEYIGDMLGKGQALANAPYQQYMGPLTAGESGLQSKVFGGLQNTNFPSNFGQSFSSTGAYAPPQMNMDAYKTQPIGTGPQPDATMDSGQQPDYQPQVMFGSTGQPGQMPQGGLAGLAGRMPQQPQGIASQYMNPYLQSVLDPQMAELRRQNDITNMMSNAKATGMGAFGGGRQAIMNAENNRNLMQEMNKTVGQGYASAYDKAQNQFNVEQGQGMGLARLMADQGAQQRGIEAEGIAADKAAFEAARENPYKMLQFQQSMLQGMPISATNIETATPSKLQEILSGIGGGIKMVGNTPSNVSMKSVTDLLGNLGLGRTPG
jgi:hypothetical protein